MPSQLGHRETRARLTLGQAFGLGLVFLALLLLGLFSFVLGRSHESLVGSAASLAQAKSENVAQQVDDSLRQAEHAASSLENQVRHGACDAQAPASVEAQLFARLLDNPALAEAAFTHAGAGWQISVYRTGPEQDSAIHSRLITRQHGRLVAQVRSRAAGTGLLDADFRRQAEVPPDPTEHPTFWRPLQVQERRDEPAFTWTDLSYSELDAKLPEPRRRVVLTVMKVVRERDMRIAGVVRVGRLARQIDTTVRAARAFLFDEQGRLLTRLRDQDRFDVQDDDLRVLSANAPPEVRAALALPGVTEMWTDGRDGPRALERTLQLAGRGYLVHFQVMEHTQNWRVGVVRAEDELPGFLALRAARTRLLQGVLGVIVAILAAGALLLRAVRRGLAQVTDSAARLRDFDFAPQRAQAPFRDLRQAEQSLELAKTAMRAMSKYVPIGLVRELYRTGQEPVPGGELRDVSLMFTDIEGFTTLAESLSPDELARLLGRYLEVMTAAIHETGGIVDKYVGDAVMALWNVPVTLQQHPRAACAAALGCSAATRVLFESAEWAGRPPLVTRFGLHRATVMVGHFGAPDRLSYTALGDGVNLAARLEGLNKQYGTRLLASEDLRASVGDAFSFRLLDKVAVKGKRQGVRVYELVGAGPAPRAARVESYERALALYWARDFAAALALLECEHEDRPSRVLAERCRGLLATPPPDGWDGTFRATSK